MQGALLLEDTMGREAQVADPVTDTALRLAELDAARKAVAAIPAKVKSLGGTREHGVALQEAMRLFLVREQDCESKARRLLAQAGYPSDAVDQIIHDLDREFRPAA